MGIAWPVVLMLLMVAVLYAASVPLWACGLVALLIVVLIVLAATSARRQARNTEYEMDDDDPRAEGDGG